MIEISSAESFSRWIVLLELDFFYLRLVVSDLLQLLSHPPILLSVVSLVTDKFCFLSLVVSVCEQ